MKYLTLLLLPSIFFSCMMFSQEKLNKTTYKLEDGVIFKTTDKKTWQSIPTSEPVQMVAWHPHRADMFLAATKNVLYHVSALSNMWYPVLSRGENFTLLQIRHATLKWWEVWLVGSTEDVGGGKHTELWRSINGGENWSLVQRINVDAESIQLEPDTHSKFRIIVTPKENMQ